MNKPKALAKRERLARKEAATLRAKGDYFEARAKLLKERSRAKREEIREVEKRERLLSRISARVSAKRRAYFGNIRTAFRKPKKRKVSKKKARRGMTFRRGKPFELTVPFALLYALAAAIFIYAVYLIATPTQLIEYDMDLGVSNYTGFNVDTDAIHLGTVTPGSMAKRDIHLSNENDALTFVAITMEGNLSQWAGVGYNNFFMRGGQNVTIPIWATAPSTAAYGNYSAKVRITTKRII